MILVHQNTIDMIWRIYFGNYMDPISMILYLGFVYHLAQAIRRLP